MCVTASLISVFTKYRHVSLDRVVHRIVWDYTIVLVYKRGYDGGGYVGPGFLCWSSFSLFYNPSLSHSDTLSLSLILPSVHPEGLLCQQTGCVLLLFDIGWPAPLYANFVSFAGRLQISITISCLINRRKPLNKNRS